MEAEFEAQRELDLKHIWKLALKHSES